MKRLIIGKGKKLKQERKKRVKNYDERLYIKINSTDKEQIQTLAKISNITTNELVRRIIKQQINIFNQIKGK